MKNYKLSIILYICIIFAGCGNYRDSHFSSVIQMLKQNGYVIDSQDNAVLSVIQSDDYTCERVSVDYHIEQDDKYQHKEDYFCFFDAKTGKLWDIIHYEASQHDIGMACEFGIVFDDINFDGQKDVLIENGDDKGGSSYYCAYLWSEQGFYYEKTFEDIGNYRLDLKTEEIIGYQHELNHYDLYTYYRYTKDGYQCDKKEYTYHGSSIQTKVEDVEKKQVTYTVQLNPKLPNCRIEVVQADKNDNPFSLEGVDYEIKIYPDEYCKEPEVIYETVYDMQSLELNFEDLDFDGTVDMMVLYAYGMEHMSCYDIYFGEEKGYRGANSIKEFMCSSYIIYEDKKLIKYRFMAYADSNGSAWNDSLFYFKDGKIVPVRELMYMEKSMKNGDVEVSISVDSYEDENKIKLYRGIANSTQKRDEILLEAECIFYEPTLT